MYEGGSTRVSTEDSTGHAHALALHVLRLRYCPGLAVVDDYMCFEEVGDWIDTAGLEPLFRGEDCSFRRCLELAIVGRGEGKGLLRADC